MRYLQLWSLMTLILFSSISLAVGNAGQSEDAEEKKLLVLTRQLGTALVTDKVQGLERQAEQLLQISNIRESRISVSN